MASYYDIENGLIELTMEKQDKQGDAGGEGSGFGGALRERSDGKCLFAVSGLSVGCRLIPDLFL